jgi:hypothetical protein
VNALPLSTAIDLVPLLSRLASSAPVEIYPLAVASALPLSQLRVVEAGAPAVGQDEIVAERGGAVKKPSDIALGTPQGLDHHFANVSYRRSRLLVAGLDVDGSFLARQEVGNEVPNDLEDPASLPGNDGF